jgi:hypothetical protein
MLIIVIFFPVVKHGIHLVSGIYGGGNLKSRSWCQTFEEVKNFESRRIGHNNTVTGIRKPIAVDPMSGKR